MFHCVLCVNLEVILLYVCVCLYKCVSLMQLLWFDAYRWVFVYKLVPLTPFYSLYIYITYAEPQLCSIKLPGCSCTHSAHSLLDSLSAPPPTAVAADVVLLIITYCLPCSLISLHLKFSMCHRIHTALAAAAASHLMSAIF